MIRNFNKSSILRTAIISLTALSLLACTDAKHDRVAYADCLNIVEKFVEFEKKTSRNIDENAVCSCLLNAINERYSDKEQTFVYELASDVALMTSFQPENIDYNNYDLPSVDFIKTIKIKFQRDFLSCYAH